MTSEALFSQLLSELCIEISFRSFQKQMTINSSCPHCNQQCELLNEKGGVDIYGNKIDSNGGMSHNISANTSSLHASDTTTLNSGMITVECPCCKKVLAATRFAPHLEKCMGMGRQSARKRGNVMMKMAAGSENESDDQADSSIATRTPALQINDDTFNIAASGSGGGGGGGSDTKKVKVSPGKAKTPNNSKSASPSKNKRMPASTGANVITPSKSKTNSVNKK